MMSSLSNLTGNTIQRTLHGKRNHRKHGGNSYEKSRSRTTIYTEQDAFFQSSSTKRCLHKQNRTENVMDLKLHTWKDHYAPNAYASLEDAIVRVKGGTYEWFWERSEDETFTLLDAT